MTTAEAVALTRVYRRRIGQYRLGGAVLMARLWDGLPGYDEANLEEFAERGSVLLDELGSRSVALSGGYYARLADDVFVPEAVQLVTDMRHPFIGVWKALADGVEYRQAVAEGRHRAGVLAQERVIRSARAVGSQADSLRGIVGWRRVPQGSTCSWCMVVSTQRYRTADSASFGHGHKGVDYCDCDVVPITGRGDPGRVINRPLLEAWKKAQGGDAPAYFDADSLDPAPRPAT